MTKAEWLARYDALNKEREILGIAQEQAEETGNYYLADEMTANLNEKLAELADDAAGMFRLDREHAEDVL